jgi:hypothetical protein
MKLEYKGTDLRTADKAIKKLLQKIIETKRGGTTKDGNKASSRTLNKKSGKLYKNIKPIIKVVDDELLIDIKVMEYYQYLDEGTERIKYPWFLTGELIEKAEFLDIIDELYAKGIKNSLIKTLSEITKDNSV